MRHVQVAENFLRQICDSRFRPGVDLSLFEQLYLKASMVTQTKKQAFTAGLEQVSLVTRAKSLEQKDLVIFLNREKDSSQVTKVAIRVESRVIHKK